MSAPRGITPFTRGACQPPGNPFAQCCTRDGASRARPARASLIGRAVSWLATVLRTISRVMCSTGWAARCSRKAATVLQTISRVTCSTGWAARCSHKAATVRRTISRVTACGVRCCCVDTRVGAPPLSQTRTGPARIYQQLTCSGWIDACGWRIQTHLAGVAGGCTGALKGFAHALPQRHATQPGRSRRFHRLLEPHLRETASATVWTPGALARGGGFKCPTACNTTLTFMMPAFHPPS